MFSSSLIAVALAGVATAFTPPGFEPASSNNLTVAFGNVLAVNGVDIPKADTATAPTVGTTERLVGTYAIMMVDPDIPPQTAGGPTGELLHWMQAGLVSANTTTTIGGVKVFELINPGNTSALASYIQPSPPNKAPLSHRYTQMLLNTTGNSTVLSTLSKFAATRTNFSAVNVVKSAGLTVLAGNSFNVTAATNTTAGGAAANSTSTTKASTSTSTRTTTLAGGASATATGKGNATTTTAGPSKSTGGAVSGKSAGSGAIIAGLGALAAAVAML